MISRVLTQTSSISSSSELQNLWSGAEHEPIVPSRPRVMRYESGVTLVTPSSGKHTPLDKVCITWFFSRQVLVLTVSL